MNHEEFREKVRRSVAKAIEEKRDLDGLVDVLKKILYYEISAFSDKIKAHEPPDMALIAYKGRHYFKMGYDKRDLELSEAINKELSVYKGEGKPLEPTTSPDSPTEENPVGDRSNEPQEVHHNISNSTVEPIL